MKIADNSAKKKNSIGNDKRKNINSYFFYNRSLFELCKKHFIRSISNKCNDCLHRKEIYLKRVSISRSA